MEHTIYRTTQGVCVSLVTCNGYASLSLHSCGSLHLGNSESTDETESCGRVSVKLCHLAQHRGSDGWLKKNP